MLNDRLSQLTDYPFQRLSALLDPIRPLTGSESQTISMSIGEPQHAAPPLVAEILAQSKSGWSKYPPINGTKDFRDACAYWLTQRYQLPLGMVDERNILPLAGTREGLFFAAQLVVPEKRHGAKPVVLLPNPFYQVYLGAAVLAGAEPYLVPAGKETGFQPDFSAVPKSILERTALAYLCSPANPQGSVANPAYLARTLELARKHGFVLACDECYSEIYDATPPAGALEAAAAAGGSLENLLIFNSLSKRSNVPGLRSGFVAGAADMIQAFQRLRSYGGAAIPLPILAVSTALWRDETHVQANRLLYRAKFDAAERIFGDRFGFFRPAGGFFLWLDVGNGEAAAKALWEKAYIRVLPGAYLARTDNHGDDPGRAYIRVALVHDLDVTERGLKRMAEVFEEVLA